jgi:hypothetical protein
MSVLRGDKQAQQHARMLNIVAQMKFYSSASIVPPLILRFDRVACLFRFSSAALGLLRVLQGLD